MLTDDELKILRTLRFNALGKVNFYIPTDKFDYLLARLDAAEDILANGITFTYAEDCDMVEHHDLECTCPAKVKWDKWLASKGQKEGA